MFDKKKYYREYYKNNKKKFLGYIKKYQQSEKGQEKIKEYRKTYNALPEIRKKRRVKDREKYHKNPTIKIYKTINKQIKDCIKRYIRDGELKLTNSTHNFYSIVYGINLYDLIDYLKPFPKDIENYELDHIIPIREFDLTDRDQIKKAYKKTNLQLLTSIANKNKR